MHLLEKTDKPIVFAHRGYAARAPENTIEAFELAFNSGAQAIELDTMLCADGIPVVIHDQKVDRTTNGKGFVKQFTFDQLQLLEAGSWFSNEFKEIRIPSLEAVLERFGAKHFINIELKSSQQEDDRLSRAVIELIQKIKITLNIIISSFDARLLDQVIKIDPDIKIAKLCPPGFIGKICQKKKYSLNSPDLIHPHFSTISRNFLEKNHSMGRNVNTWTVDDIDTAKRLFELGVDGIITNQPEKILKAIN